jgi:NADH-quinone oxidoreductase subunit J
VTAAFYIAAFVAVISTFMVIVSLNAVHALLYLVVSLLSVALIFLLLGAPFVAALEVIIYAGAIMVLFVFVIMMLRLGPPAVSQERTLLGLSTWLGPAILVAVLIVELLYVFSTGETSVTGPVEVTPRQVGISLLGPYLLGVELVSMLLLVGLVGAYHLAHRLGRKRSAPATDRGGI